MTSSQPYHNVPVTPRGRRPKGGKYCMPQTLRLHPLPPQISAQHQPARSGLISCARPVKIGSGGGSSQSRNKSNHGPVSWTQITERQAGRAKARGKEMTLLCPASPYHFLCKRGSLLTKKLDKAGCQLLHGNQCKACNSKTHTDCWNVNPISIHSVHGKVPGGHD